MGHSSLQVSLTYLRGLETKPLEIDDMPILAKKNSIHHEVGIRVFEFGFC